MFSVIEVGGRVTSPAGSSDFNVFVDAAVHGGEAFLAVLVLGRKYVFVLRLFQLKLGCLPLSRQSPLLFAMLLHAL
uniref:Uncharacterized protein n=1 Tax=Cannabis sativa TaxID=3483 RepID=A0A803NZG9_CANSA